MGVIYILWLRELKRYTRSRAQMIASLGQPVLYLLALGFGMGPVYAQAGHGSYLQFLAPGVIGMTVLFSSIFSGMGLLWDRQFGSHYGGTHAGRSYGGDLPGIAGYDCLRHLRLQTCESGDGAAGHALCGLDRCGLRRAGYDDRVSAQGYAGLSDDYEFSGHADFFPLRRLVSTEQSAQGAGLDYGVRSTGLRH
jgi:hypothetical protein